MFENYTNPHSSRLRFVGGLCLIAGIIGGMITGNATREFSWGIASYFWISSIIGTVFIFGFAEIIEILSRILQEMKPVIPTQQEVKTQEQ